MGDYKECPKCHMPESKKTIVVCNTCGYNYSETQTGPSIIFYLSMCTFVAWAALTIIYIIYAVYKWLTTSQTLVSILYNLFIEPLTRLY